jgi:GntR family transcriptional regulator
MSVMRMTKSVRENIVANASVPTSSQSTRSRDEPKQQQEAVDRSPNDIPISIDTSCGIPLWLQLRNRLTYLITSGHFRCGDRLPTVRNLAVDLGINFNTVSKVYRDIEHDGYIISRQGAGTFVSDEYRRREGVPLTETDLLIDEFIRECLELGVPKDDIAGLVIERLMSRDDAESGERL